MIFPPPFLNWFERFFQAFSEQRPQNKQQLIQTLHEAQQRNLLTADTLAMLEGALQVADMHVRDIMIPRAQMVVVELDAPPDFLIKTVAESGHSRFPVIGDNRDNVQGIFLAKDLLEYFSRNEQSDQSFNIRDVMRPAVFIPESKRLNVLLREFRTSRNHMAIVVDEYSGVAGLVTIEDVIEEIVGEIDDEHDVDEHVYIKPRQEGLYSVLALTPIDEFNDYFKTNFTSDEVHTIGGLVTQAFGHLPKRGETIDLEGFHFEVVRANTRRIHLLRLNLLTVPNSSSAES